MRVLCVTWEYPPRLFGGLGRHVEGLVGALAEAGADVTVLTPHSDEPEPDRHPRIRVLRAPAPAVALPADRWLAGTLDANVAMAAAALRAGVVADVLHVHDWMAGHAARVLAPALGVGVVATVHATERGRHQGHLPPGYSAWIDAQERQLIALADRVVVCADHMADHVSRHLGADLDVGEVIPNGVDVVRWGAARPRPAGPLPRVVFAGRLEHEKGVDVLLAATEGLDCEVVVAGAGTQAPALRRSAHDRVRFEGHLAQPALAALLRSAAVVVVPSRYEPFGLAALEAMAAGVPVVASAVGGLLDVVAGDAGVRVPPGDVRALRQAISAVLGDPDRAAALARTGQARAAAFSWARSADAHLAVYDAVRRW
ncbi:glycosyltransferase family 4 protein [Euzebya sp.]|uniref:glycosyltransferase family 4 protein n=1 Tax=Euzebya sp. TaxID=1971409 RepID=UPI0035155484